MATSPRNSPPTPFGDYLLLDRINIGGMAEVWRGKIFGAGGFERLVAIKRILPNIAEDEEFISMFIDEAKISVQLTHANIAQIYELGQIGPSLLHRDGVHPRQGLRRHLRRAPEEGRAAPRCRWSAASSARCARAWTTRTARRTARARDLNIVHRDVSPQNILISFEGEVKVIDFGIAKAAGKATKTQAGHPQGQVRLHEPGADPRAAAGPAQRRVRHRRVPLRDAHRRAALRRARATSRCWRRCARPRCPRPPRYNRKIPEALEKIVLKALAKDVDERYQYASELGDDLQRFLISDSTSRKDLPVHEGHLRRGRGARGAAAVGYGAHQPRPRTSSSPERATRRGDCGPLRGPG